VGLRGLLLVAALGWLHDPSCGTDTPAGGLNTPCTRSSDCQGGLTCTGAVCVAVDSGGTDGGESPDARTADAGGAE
jgi:hypothetical protein